MNEVQTINIKSIPPSQGFGRALIIFDPAGNPIDATIIATNDVEEATVRRALQNRGFITERKTLVLVGWAE